MPVSLDNSVRLHLALKAQGVCIVSALPETWLVHLIRLADDDPATTLVRLAKEEEGVGVSMGAHLAGKRSAMLMQNHGFLAAINGVVSGAMLYRVPLVMLISDRGAFGEEHPWQTEGGGFTRPLLRALGLQYEAIDTPEAIERTIQGAYALAEASLRPVGVLLTRQLMWEEAPRHA